MNSRKSLLVVITIITFFCVLIAKGAEVDTLTVMTDHIQKVVDEYYLPF